MAPRSQVLPSWERRGIPEHLDGDQGGSFCVSPYTLLADTLFDTVQVLADGVIRCVPGEDHTNGFFVSCFIKEGTTDQKRKRSTEEDEEDDGVYSDDEGVAAANEEVAISGTTTKSSKRQKKNKRKKKKKASSVTAAAV